MNTTQMASHAPTVHNGTYTVKNSKTGDYRTFKISTAKAGGLKGKRIVSLLSGSDNEGDYRGFGFLNDNGIAVWRKMAGGAYSQYALMIWRLLVLKNLNGYDVMASTTCCRCNRKLTTPESIEFGIGPVCADKM